MKYNFEPVLVVDSATRHLKKTVSDNTQHTGKFEYKRFYRRGNRSEISRADNKFFADLPNSTCEYKPTLVLHETVGAPEPVASYAGQVPLWDALHPVTVGGPQEFTDNTPLVSFNRNDPASRAFDQLRTHLLQTLRSNGWSRIAIAAPTTGCGSTFTATNLALSFARVQGSRILLMDMNMRTPGIAAALGVNCTRDMRGYLSGKINPSRYLVRATDTLALGLASTPVQDASELLLHRRTTTVLNKMDEDYSPDITIFDLPPVLAFDDLAAFLPQVDGVLIVSDGTKTTRAHIEACKHSLEGRTNFLGVVLNHAPT